MVYGVAGLYDRLMMIDFSKEEQEEQEGEEKTKRIAYVISAFQYKRYVTKNCTTEACFAHMREEVPSTMPELVRCMRKQNCQIMNRHLTTYVWHFIISSFHHFINHDDSPNHLSIANGR